MRDGYLPGAEHEPELHFPPASGTEAKPSGKVPPGRPDDLLQPGRPPCTDHAEPGNGACHGINIMRGTGARLRKDRRISKKQIIWLMSLIWREVHYEPHIILIKPYLL